MALNSSVVKLSLFVIIIVLLSNAFMIIYFQYTSTKTTYILSNTFNKFKGSSLDNENDAIKIPVKNNIPADTRQVVGDDSHADGQFRRESKQYEYLSTKTSEAENERVSADTAQGILEDTIVDQMIGKMNMSKRLSIFPPDYWSTSLYTLTRQLGQAARNNAKRLRYYENKSRSGSLPNFEKVHRNIRQFSYYDPDDPALKNLLVDLATLDINQTAENDGGTQLKINIRFSDGGRAIIKFMRLAREVESNPNVYVFGTVERHVAEIAAFQLDKTLGFYRVPPAVGRWINITQLLPLMPESIRKTVHTSPECSYYCSELFPFCGNPDMIEAAVMSRFPQRSPRLSWDQPWRRSYNRNKKAHWETDDDYCDSVRNKAPYNNSRLLLDIVDTHTFDFLTGNKDRHGISSYEEWNCYSFPILFDNGRGFGQADYDAMSILAPLRQCCIIRKSTFLKYVKLYTAPERLSDLMRQALAEDPVAPVLIPGHLNALDRRIVKILRAVAECLQNFPTGNVIISDQF